MSLPTTDTIFATARAADSWIEYPFIEIGDPTAKIYHMRCRQNLVDYDAAFAGNNNIPLSRVMSSAINAQVISLPFPADGVAYFCGDFNHSYSEGLLVEFDRIFATKPADINNLFVGSRSSPFPGVRSVLKTTPASAADAATDENLWRWSNQGSGNTSPAPLYVDITYKFQIQFNSFPIPEVFQVTHAGNNVDYVSNGGSGVFSNATAQNGEIFSGSYSVPATVPSATDYATSVTNGEKKIVDVQIERYKGEMFSVKTYKMIAQ